jgi:hypothetical protein
MPLLQQDEGEYFAAQWSCMTNSDWITLAAAIATFSAVAVTIVALWVEIRRLNQQFMLQHFADYTKRYLQILLQFPEDINVASLMPESDPQYQQTMRQMRAYFDLCFEEWHLKQHKLLRKDIWSLWESGMEASLSKPAFKQAWARIRTDSRFGKPFEEYIDSLGKKSA